MKAKRDETLEEIWAIRRQIAKLFRGDPQKRVAYYQRKQKESGARIYRPESRSGLTFMPMTHCTKARTRRSPLVSAPP